MDTQHELPLSVKPIFNMSFNLTQANWATRSQPSPFSTWKTSVSTFQGIRCLLLGNGSSFEVPCFSVLIFCLLGSSDGLISSFNLVSSTTGSNILFPPFSKVMAYSASVSTLITSCVITIRKLQPPLFVEMFLCVDWFKSIILVFDRCMSFA